MKMVLIRHAETLGNREKRYLGRTESPLTEKGEKMQMSTAEKAIACLAGEKNEKTGIFTSPSGRAQSMADAVAAGCELTPATDERLAEMDFGIFDGLTARECETRHPDAWQAWMADFMHYKVPGGESNEDVQQRVSDFLSDLSVQALDTAVVITHGGIIRAMMTQLLDLPSEAAWHFNIALGGVAIIDVIDGYGILKTLNF